MDSHLQTTLARIGEIEARLGMVAAPQTPPPTPSTTASAGANAANKPFDVMVAQAGGNVRLQPINGASGLFPTQIDGLVEKYAAQNGLSPELVRAVIQQESGGNAKSVSAVGAKGLMQLMPETAQGYGVTDPFDPEQNISAGTRHLAGLMREFQGDTARALAAYNAGAGAVKKYNGVPPFAETQQYVHRIMGMLGR